MFSRLKVSVRMPILSLTLAAFLCGVIAVGLPAGHSARAAEGVPYEYAWPYHEWGEPTGAYAGKPPLGYILIVHGGAWVVVGQAQVEASRFKADEYRARGWATLSTTYRAGTPSGLDVAAMGDLMRHRAGPGMPLCLWGGSAGGQLALIAAAVRAYDCVISEAGPIDLVGVEHQTANGSPVGPLQGFLHAITVFGLENLWKKSPLSVASQIEGRLLLATGKFDPVIPLEQMAEMKAARPSTKTMELEGGGPTDPYFVHAHISAEAKQRFESAVDATLSGARQDVAGYYARPTSVKFAARNKGAWFSSRLRVSVAVSGSVSRVEFRVDGKRVAGDRRKPFGFTYRPARKIALGRHRLSAVAFPLSGRAVAASTRVQRVQPQSLRSACAKAKRRVRAAPTARARRAARLARDRRCP